MCISVSMISYTHQSMFMYMYTPVHMLRYMVVYMGGHVYGCLGTHMWQMCPKRSRARRPCGWQCAALVCIAPDAAMAPKMNELMAMMQGDLEEHVSMKRPAGAGGSGASKKGRAEAGGAEPPLKKPATGDAGDSYTVNGWGFIFQSAMCVHSYTVRVMRDHATLRVRRGAPYMKQAPVHKGVHSRTK